MTLCQTLARLFLLGVLVATGPARAEERHHWGYEGHGSPASWASLDPGFSACKLGHLQSPIDIRGAKVADLPALRFEYRPSPLKIVDNGHTIQVNYAPGSAIEVGGTRYELVQFHFHRPSEEKINGKAHAMVAHLVHRDAAGRLAVVAVLLDKGGASELIDTLWKNIPKERAKERELADVHIDATQLLPPDRRYYTFQGSLTTPPCSEGVTWFVLKTPLKIADAQTATFARLYPHNSRPVQPLHGRLVQTMN
jgi:carbonic anhydrase